MKKQLIISFTILALLFIATTGVVLYGKGYRFWFEKGKPDISGTGLLVATSKPDGAQVFINDHLTTATDSTINLAPGSYAIKVYKDGYFPWSKQVTIQKEVVMKADATLFPTAPKLESITTTGVQNPVLDPSGSQIAYTISSSSARKNGVYVLDLASRSFLTLQSSATQITDDTTDAFSRANLSWSPDGKELVASISAQLQSPTFYQLNGASFNDAPQDVTNTLDTVLSTWQTQKNEKETAQVEGLQKDLMPIVQKYFSHMTWSPDETKILYVASSSATIPTIIKPPLIGTNQTPQTRNIEEGKIYVYDIKEDKNYQLPITTIEAETPRWYFDSKHIVWVTNKRINIVDYDGQNDTTVYAGPFLDNYVFPSPNSSKIVILTNLGNTDTPPNLYSLELQ